MDEETQLLTRAVDLERELGEVRLALAGLPRTGRKGGVAGLLLCRSGSTGFAISVEKVDEVVPNAARTELPGAEPWVLGAINVEGVLVPVVDVASRLGGSVFRSTVDDALVLCRDGNRRLALCVTEVPSLHHVLPELVLPVPAELQGTPYVAGCVQVLEDTVPLISIVTLSVASGLFARET